jgi:methyltransferase (TIGR00027 family)
VITKKECKETIMANPAAQTAYGPMSVIVAEQYLPERQRLVQDALAIQLMPPVLKAILKLFGWSALRNFFINTSEKRAPGVWGGALCRKRYIEDRLREAVSAGLQAVVILGAGLDTLACRLSELSTLPVFEVDLPENSECKKAALQKLFGAVPAHMTLVPVDFESQDLGARLAAHGYQTGYKTFFVWEAVTQYLTEAGVRKTFDFLAKAKAGSRLVFTYIRKDFIAGTASYGLDYLYQNYCVKRQLWHFGFDPRQVASFLAEYAWQELEQVGAQEYTDRYLKPYGRPMAVLEIERAVFAEKLNLKGYSPDSEDL